MLPPNGPSASRPQMMNRPIPASSGAAIASLVLGILSIATCLTPLGILAVIFGHVASSRVKRSGGALPGGGMATAGLIMGYLTSVVTAFFVSVMIYGMIDEVKDRGEPDELFTLPAMDSAWLPDLDEGRLLEGSGIRVHDLQVSGTGAAGTTRLRVLIPAGAHAEGSLPCVLVAPAGSDLLSGMDLDDGDYLDESRPYAEAGMVVVSYSIDGMIEDDDEKAAYRAFREAGAGVANGKVAFAFASQKLRLVNAAKIFSAGHSSAGTLSLLLASHLPGLAGAVAYAPVSDLGAHFETLIANPFSVVRYPGIEVFVQRASPLTHAARVQVPVFLFGARDDDKVGTQDWRDFARAVEEAGAIAQVKTVPSGGHYLPMIEEGIPAAITWIQEKL